MSGWFTLALFLAVSVAVASSTHCHCYKGPHKTKKPSGGNTGGGNPGGMNPGTGGGNGGMPNMGGDDDNKPPKFLPSVTDRDVIDSLVGKEGTVTKILDGLRQLG